MLFFSFFFFFLKSYKHIWNNETTEKLTTEKLISCSENITRKETLREISTTKYFDANCNHGLLCRSGDIWSAFLWENPKPDF